MSEISLRQFVSLEEAVTSLFGSNVKITGKRYIGGGDINEAYGLMLSDGNRLFMKSNMHKDESFFIAEAAGLSAIAQTKTIGTPRILCTGKVQEGMRRPFLLMEFIDSGNRIPGYWETLAYELAAMHRADTEAFVINGTYGFVQDNFIGERNQKNSAHTGWVSFFRECRLRPQLQSAEAYLDNSDRKKAGKLLERLEDILVEPGHPSLLHGDLWGGNVIAGSDGKAWLIDPAVYVGSAEADLAMTELFGGFPKAFYDAYRSCASIEPGYEYRRDLYNLYHLLNHLNMFGTSYLPSVRRTIGKYA